jgi:hypothetical protein
MDVIERCSGCVFLQEFSERCGILRMDYRYVTNDKCEEAKKRHVEGVYLAKLKKIMEDKWR